MNERLERLNADVLVAQAVLLVMLRASNDKPALRAKLVEQFARGQLSGAYLDSAGMAFKDEARHSMKMMLDATD